MSTTPAPEPGPSTGPERIRALAHPVRLEILEFLERVTEATATECAQHTGQTVANCSFHLRTLAKYGFIAAATPRGREKPWRSRTDALDLRPDVSSPASVRAAGELASLTLAREADRLRAYFARAAAEPGEWRRASMLTSDTFWATAGELRALADEIIALTARFDGRSEPANRPQGARLSRLFAAVNPEPEQEPRPGGQSR